MKTLYIDCSMGASGDMLAGALLDLIPDSMSVIAKINELIPSINVRLQQTTKCGINGKHFDVQFNNVHFNNVHFNKENSNESYNEHKHFHFEDLMKKIDGMDVSQKVKKDIFNVYNLLANAESHVHNVPVKEIHFHEVGELDALADISAVCILMDKISADSVIASPVNVGSGHVKCSHGILPVPAPATVELLKGIPIYSAVVQEELCTPTGAALLKYFVDSFSSMPVMKIDSVGYGMGTKNFDTLNSVRLILGETVTEEKKDCITSLQCNIDDMTAEDLANAQNVLLNSGALDVYLTTIQMKKSRCAVLLSVLCKNEDKHKFIKLIFKTTTTIGIREQSFSRYILEREIKILETDFGPIRKKISYGYGVKHEKYEHNDLIKMSENLNKNLEETRNYLREQYNF